LVLAACSSGDGGAREPRESSVLERLSDADACDLISDASVEKAFEDKIGGKHGLKHGRVDDSTLRVECDYQIPLLSTDVSTTRPEETDQEIVDSAFRDWTMEGPIDERPVREYEEVPDLGIRAGFGQNAHYGQYADAWKLCVLFDVDGERLELTLSVTGPAELDQLRPLAEEALFELTG
jgi:hypothetical protein